MFEYDPDKSAANLAKHGIDFEAVQALWTDDLRLVVDTQFLSEPRQLVSIRRECNVDNLPAPRRRQEAALHLGR